MKEIPLTQDKVALVDDEDYEWLSQWKWHYNTRGYAKRTQVKPIRVELAMHRVIMNAPIGMDVDHINKNKLDNRRSNLRVVAHKDNTRYSKRRLDSTKKYKGVFMDKRCKDKPYFAQIGVDGKKITKGYFATEEDAAAMYNMLATIYFGKFAVLNDV